MHLHFHSYWRKQCSFLSFPNTVWTLWCLMYPNAVFCYQCLLNGMEFLSSWVSLEWITEVWYLPPVQYFVWEDRDKNWCVRCTLLTKGDSVYTCLQIVSPTNALIRLFSMAVVHSSRWAIINKGCPFSFWQVIFLGEYSVSVVWQSPQILQCSEGLHWRAHPVASHWAGAVHLEWACSIDKSQITYSDSTAA